MTLPTNQPKSRAFGTGRIPTEGEFVRAVEDARAAVWEVLGHDYLAGLTTNALCGVAFASLLTCQQLLGTAMALQGQQRAKLLEWCLSRALDVLLVLEHAATLVPPPHVPTAHCAPLARACAALRPIYTAPQDLPS